MIYIIGCINHRGSNKYVCFDANTESKFSGTAEDLIKWIDEGVNINNMKVINNKPVMVDWLSGMHYTSGRVNTRADCILLCKMSGNKFKLVNYNGKIRYIEKEQLYEYSKKEKVANCEIRNNKLISVGAYSVIEDTNFEKAIAEQYKIYVAKTALLGCNMSFKYLIEGKEVKLVRYTGTSKEVIVPKFVTTIMYKAFLNCGIETITLDKGLKHIGKLAFEGCSIAEIVIPDTVEIIGLNAFQGNKKLIASDNKYTDAIKLLNTKTIVISKQ